MRGRVASLLEVGTGFHPELTGRENIFLNGAILGMTKSEIRRRFDEIVAFSEIDRFIDTPAKRYSSGMYVRLAFAVAAHLDPEILIVDEVLAVGDLDFQVKCFKKIKAVATGGKTVLLVSHNIAAVQQLCKRAILLANGSVYATGCVENVLRHYVATSTLEGQIGGPQGSRPKWAAPWINSIRMTTSTGVLTSTFQLGDDLGIEFDFQQPECKAISRPVMGVVIKNATGAVVGAVNTRMSAQTTFRSSAHLPLSTHCPASSPGNLYGRRLARRWCGEYRLHRGRDRFSNLAKRRLRHRSGALRGDGLHFSKRTLGI
jgi:lipopolysaccharide transport system ATP-binding protein